MRLPGPNAMTDAAPSPLVPRVLLALVAVGVWAAVAWQYTQATDALDNPVSRPTIRERAPDSRAGRAFVLPSRDPFLPLASDAANPAPVGVQQAPTITDTVQASPARVRRASPVTTYNDVFGSPTPSTEDPRPSVEPPDFIFRGVVGNRALLEGPGGRTELVREGEQVEGATLGRINGEFVTVHKGGQTFVIFPE